MTMEMGCCKNGLDSSENEPDVAEPINFQLENTAFERSPTIETWDLSLEDIKVKEDLEWLGNAGGRDYTYEELQGFIRRAPPKRDISRETDFVSPDLLRAILDAKEIFNELDQAALSRARARANPFEKIKNVFFMNRAALKMANIDAATGSMFTDIDYDPRHRDPYGPYYFADVCAGPGGFTEYVLWRKRWCFKGFGLTLRGRHDFRLHESICASPNTFQAYYGAAGDGNVCNVQNIADFKGKVLRQTKGSGVHFMMADGGFSVEGCENLQEVLSKQLYVCQCLMALEIVRPGGHFVTKLFDLFTKFSVGLIYLMHQCFEQIAIFKPNSSRPANSERYLIGKSLRSTATTDAIRRYIRRIATDLWDASERGTAAPPTDIDEIVPEAVLRGDAPFYDYVRRSNGRIGEAQRVALLKLAAFCRDPSLVEPRQDGLRAESLRSWRIPDRARSAFRRADAPPLPSFAPAAPVEVRHCEDLARTVTAPGDWHFAPLISSRRNDYCHFYAGASQSKVYKLVKNRWVKVKNVRLNEGTLVYAELVKERCAARRTGEESERLSLHIIDALRLEDTSLADIPFRERSICIRTFCEALNFEGSAETNIRIRPKIIYPLSGTILNDTIIRNKVNGEYSTSLEVLGFNCNRESFTVNSVLLLKTGECYSFDATYALRAQVYISRPAIDDDQTPVVPLEKIVEHIETMYISNVSDK